MNHLTKLISWYNQGDYDRRLVKWGITIQLLLLALSLFHQSRAIAGVTGMNGALAFLQSVVTDGGLFVAELTLLRFLETGRSVLWTGMFVLLVAVASAGANVYDFTGQLEPGTWKWKLAFAYGVSIPFQVLLLGKMISQLVMPKKKERASGTGVTRKASKAVQSDTTRNRLRVAK
jgi:hypothetical protein